MRIDELLTRLNSCGFDKWPEYIEVDIETYALVCEYLFAHKIDQDGCIRIVDTKGYIVQITLGQKGHPLFKNVEIRPGWK